MLAEMTVTRVDAAHAPGMDCQEVIESGSAGRYDAFKRVLDVVLTVPLLIIAAPIIFVAGLCVRLTSRGPALYTQLRVGRQGRLYTIYKIRTMTADCERQSGPRWAATNDPRVTTVGRVLRRLHLDELPQLWNVLRGEMSLIGPRPERPEFVATLQEALPNYRQRLAVRPGVTGLAQVQLPPDSDLASVRRKLAHDLYYLRQLSLWLDFRILLATVLYVGGVRPGVLARLLGLSPHRETAPLAGIEAVPPVEFVQAGVG